MVDHEKARVCMGGSLAQATGKAGLILVRMGQAQNDVGRRHGPGNAFRAMDEDFPVCLCGHVGFGLVLGEPCAIVFHN